MRRYWGIADTLSKMIPGAKWSCRDDDYDKIEWFSPEIPKPTLEEIQAKQAELEADEPMRVVREIRDWYIQQSDWTQGYDIRQLRGPEWCAAWDAYRQQLRDLPASGIVPYFNEMNLIMGVDWPQKPNLS